ncbi:hypothetical protein GCM10009765_71820 [Fodinicola feengrottensis]|uniref:Phage capsid-like C-terminal domain-containing protein n=1 Tax=Fodinicola feengrottensis TaxID=435914 RepID=A0ABN2IV02_9ACTN
MTAVLNPVELRTGLEGLGEKLNDLRSKSEQTAEVRAEIKQTIEDIRSQDALLCVAERSAEGERRTQSAPQVGTSAFGSEARSAGQQFVDSDGFRDYAQRGAQGQYEGEVRTLLTQGDGTAGGGLFVPRGTPLPPVPNRQRLFVRDLLSVIPTNLLSVPYIRESNNASDDALITGPTAEGSNKPEVAMTFTAQDAPIRTIAGWIPVTRQLLANAPTVSGYIDSRLGYMVQLAEEKQVLNGSGTAPAIRGIRQTTGLQTLTDPSTGAVGVDMIAMLGLAIGKVEAVGGVADGIAMNASDYWTMVTKRNSGTGSFDGNFPAGNPFTAGPANIWGIPTVRTPSMEVTKALVGSYKLGATLLENEGITIRVGDQHSDYFIGNKVVVLAEENVGLAVSRPDYFVEVDFTDIHP